MAAVSLLHAVAQYRIHKSRVSRSNAAHECQILCNAFDAQNDDPNTSLYRLGHLLALQDCAYRAAIDRVRFVANIDVDEFILPSNSVTLVCVFRFIGYTSSQVSLLNTLTQQYPKAASFQFDAVRVHYSVVDKFRNDTLSNDSFRCVDVVEKAQSVHFSWLTTLSNCESSKAGPPKYVYLPQRVLQLGNHAVVRALSAFERKVIVPSSDGRLYHLRINQMIENVECNFTHSPLAVFISESPPSIAFDLDTQRVTLPSHDILYAPTICSQMWKELLCRPVFELCNDLAPGQADSPYHFYINNTTELHVL